MIALAGESGGKQTSGGTRDVTFTLRIGVGKEVDTSLKRFRDITLAAHQRILDAANASAKKRTDYEIAQHDRIISSIQRVGAAYAALDRGPGGQSPTVSGLGRIGRPRSQSRASLVSEAETRRSEQDPSGRKTFTGRFSESAQETISRVRRATAKGNNGSEVDYELDYDLRSQNAEIERQRKEEAREKLKAEANERKRLAQKERDATRKQAQEEREAQRQQAQDEREARKKQAQAEREQAKLFRGFDRSEADIMAGINSGADAERRALKRQQKTVVSREGKEIQNLEGGIGRATKDLESQLTKGVREYETAWENAWNKNQAVFNRANESILLGNARMSERFKQSTESALKFGRGVAMLGLVGEEDTQKVVDGLLKVQGVFDILNGGIGLFRSAKGGLEAYRNTIESVSKAKGAMSVSNELINIKLGTEAGNLAASSLAATKAKESFTALANAREALRKKLLTETTGDLVPPLGRTARKGASAVSQAAVGAAAEIAGEVAAESLEEASERAVKKSFARRAASKAGEYVVGGMVSAGAAKGVGMLASSATVGGAGAAGSAAASGGAAAGGVAGTIATALAPLTAAVAAIGGAGLGLTAILDTIEGIRENGLGGGTRTAGITGAVDSEGRLKKEGGTFSDWMGQNIASFNSRLAGAAQTVEDKLGSLAGQAFRSATMIGNAFDGLASSAESLKRAQEQQPEVMARAANLRAMEEREAQRRAAIESAQEQIRTIEEQREAQLRELSTQQRTRRRTISQEVGQDATRRQLDELRSSLALAERNNPLMAANLRRQIAATEREQRSRTEANIDFQPAREIVEDIRKQISLVSQLRTQRRNMEGLGTDEERSKLDSQVTAAEEKLAGLTKERLKIEEAIADVRRRNQSSSIDSIHKEIQLRQQERTITQDRLKSAAERFGDLSMEDKLQVIRSKQKADLAGQRALTMGESYEDQILETKSRMGGEGALSDEERSKLASFQERKRQASSFALTREERQALGMVDTAETNDIRQRGAIAEAERFGFSKMFGKDERNRILEEQMAVQKLQVELKDKRELNINVMRNDEEQENRIVNSVLAILARKDAAMLDRLEKRIADNNGAQASQFNTQIANRQIPRFPS